MAKIIGIDFGTTNSLISVILGGKAKNYLNDQRMPHPSVVSYASGQTVVGRIAKEQLADNSDLVIDDIVKSPKTKLGKGTFVVTGKELEPSKVVADLMTFLKDNALSQVSSADDERDTDFSKAVVSIPVAMDGRTRRELRDSLLQAGIHIVQFVHEPLAALYCYFKDKGDYSEAMSLMKGKLALVFDWGGGTLDLTLCRISGETITQVMNFGDNNVGGDYIDEAIRSFILEQHSLVNSIEESLPVNPGARAKLLHECERAKISLSEKEKVLVYLPDYYAVSEDYRDIEIRISRDQLNALSETYINRGLNSISKLLGDLDIDQRRISLCLATGGMVNMPVIKQSLLQLFSIERLEISKKGERIISEGCSWIAHDNLRMSLAKPIEVQEARQSFYSVFKSGTPLPYEGDVITEQFDMYCVDPRDGKAKFQIVKPQQLDKVAATDPRVTLGNLVVEVDVKAEPFRERLNLEFAIDDNFILTILASSALTQKADKCEIFDLEFSLALIGSADSANGDSASEESESTVGSSDVSANSVRARSNVAFRKNDERMVPGELLYSYKPRALDPEAHDRATDLQFDEKMYYQACVNCRQAPCQCRAHFSA
jgi:actin-like ATPase involved in cell morphogenesis